MNERLDPGDDAVRELLDRRARRVGTDGQLAAIRSAAAATPQRQPGRLRLGFVHGLAAGATGAAALGILVVLLATAFGSRTPVPPIGATASGAVPSSTPSSGPPATPVIPDAAQPVLPLTVDQLNSILLPDSTALQSRLLVIDATIAVNPARSSPPAILQGSTPILRVEIAAAASLPGPMPWTGTFAARMIDTRTMEFLEPVTLAPGGEPLNPSQLSGLSALTRSTGYVLVQGWIAGLEADLPCPLAPGSPPSGPQYGCGRTASLSDANSQPVSDLQLNVPDDGVQVQNHAYDDFAPDPQSTGPASLPERATFLLDQALLPCPAGTYCVEGSTGFHWQIAARIDPWPTPSRADPPTPGPSASPAANQPVQPLTVAQLNAYMAMNSQSPEGRELVITGTIQVMTPVTSCASSLDCPMLVLQGSNPILTIDQIEDIGPVSKTSPVIGVPSTFAATLVNGVSLRYQGPVNTQADGKAWLPSQLPSPSKPELGRAYWLVQGWISGVAVASPCPSSSSGVANGLPQYACGGLTSFLSDDATQPVRVNSGGYSVRLSAGGIEVQDGGYDSFAPHPIETGLQTEPEAGTFLVRVVSVPDCGPNEDCAVAPTSYHWEIMARLDPWPVPALP